MTINIGQFNELDLLKTIIQHSPDQIFVASASGYILDVYQGTERTYHLNYAQMIGKHYSESYSTEFSQKIDAILADVLESHCTQVVTYPIHPKDMYTYPDSDSPDETFWYEARITPLSLSDHSEPVILWWVRDITTRVRLQEDIQHRIHHDELTGIYNRRKFMDSLSEHFIQFKQSPLTTCIVMIDIDDFKQINDTLGHLAGDKVIRHVSDIASKNIREADFLARIGGEEFVVLLPHTETKEAYALAERLRHIVANTPCQLDEQPSVSTTISIGIAQFDTEDSTDIEAVNRADKAMYLSKERGKNSVTVFENQ